MTTRGSHNAYSTPVGEERFSTRHGAFITRQLHARDPCRQRQYPATDTPSSPLSWRLIPSYFLDDLRCQSARAHDNRTRAKQPRKLASMIRPIGINYCRKLNGCRAFVDRDNCFDSLPSEYFNHAKVAPSCSRCTGHTQVHGHFNPSAGN